MFVHVCVFLSLFQWSVYLNCSPCSRTSSRHAYFLCTWMAIRAALPITIIYIKFEINFTLFSLCNYVNSCCETKQQTWILIAVSFKSLWTLERKTQHYGNISVMSSQDLLSGMGGGGEGVDHYVSPARVSQNHTTVPPSICSSICLSTTELWNFESLLQENYIFNDENYVKVRISWWLVYNSELIIL